MTDYVVFAKMPDKSLRRYNAANMESHTAAIDLVKAEHPDALVLAYISKCAAEPSQPEVTAA